MNKMKVFLSWSGEKSKNVAQVLYDWLPEVIQAIDPWLSEEDIAKGSLWSGEMTAQLNQIGVGIICVTPENQEVPWLNFEAGALSKTVKDKTFVCPYLIGLKKADLKSPLSLFQAAEAKKADTLKVILTLNSALGDQARPEANVQQTFNKWWPDLESKLEEAASIKPSRGHERSQKELLEEILLLVRDMSQVVRIIPEQTMELRELDKVSKIKREKDVASALAEIEKRFGKAGTEGKLFTPPLAPRKVARPPDPK
jgi:hypothetical protein